jgi:transcriptional regulator with XRE-family HTH domain
MAKPKIAQQSRNELAPPQIDDAIAGVDVARRVGENLRRQRRARGMSLDGLATVCGVSRAALSQIEASKGNPTIGVLCRIADGLAMALWELLGEGRHGAVGVRRQSEARVVRSPDGQMERRPLTPAGAPAHAELYELRLAPHGRHVSAPHASGTKEIVVVLTGRLCLRVGAESFELAVGDSVSFKADKAHTYENPGDSEGRYHDVIFYER